MSRKKKRRFGGVIPAGPKDIPDRVSEDLNNGVEENMTDASEPEGDPPGNGISGGAETEPVSVTAAEAVNEQAAEPEEGPHPEPEAAEAPASIPEPEASEAQAFIPEPEAAEAQASVPEPEAAEAPAFIPEPVNTTPEIKETETENRTVEEEKTVKPETNDAMPDFLKSANSTIRRDGPYKNYTGNADVLRHKTREPEKGKGRRNRKKRQRQRRDGIISTETISLLALVVIVGAIFFCAFKHVEMRELSLAALVVISLITIIMGALLGDAPSYVSLILVALIIIAGAITGMFSEVITAVIIFLGTVTAIKGRFE